MKILVSSMERSLNSPVDPRFGRAAWFVLVDTETGEHRAVENKQGQEAGHGAGILGRPDRFVPGREGSVDRRMGPKACDALKAAGIQICTGTVGTVGQAVETFMASRAG
ncbi:MAG: NifB/NifX family molybdenum-iron cluster-binding protein [Elusimicrobia bacterium]|nr:NifB/NifX family molybdenum-iron cluster-binding protein [Elusimicrobiota bacterium]